MAGIQGSRSSAVEFALVAPLFLCFVGGIIAYGAILGVYHGVQQLAAEAARATIAGMSDNERQQIAQSYISSNATSYVFLDSAKLKIEADPAVVQSNNYKVTLTYDMSDLFIYQFSSLLPLPEPKVQRTAVIVRGGY